MSSSKRHARDGNLVIVDGRFSRPYNGEPNEQKRRQPSPPRSVVAGPAWSVLRLTLGCLSRASGGARPGGDPIAMDGTRFDGLARRLGSERSRRAALRIAGAGLIAGLAPALARPTDADSAPVEAQACLPLGTRCGGRLRTGERQPACNKCCTSYTISQRNGQRRCSCRPDFRDCQRPDQCCSGICAPFDCGCPGEPPGPTVCLPGLFGA